MYAYFEKYREAPVPCGSLVFSAHIEIFFRCFFPFLDDECFDSREHLTVFLTLKLKQVCSI